MMLTASNPVMAGLMATTHAAIALIVFIMVAQHSCRWDWWRRAAWLLVSGTSMVVCTSILITYTVPTPQWLTYDRVQWQELWVAIALLCLAINTYCATRDAHHGPPRDGPREVPR
jgi:hypothetical protein